MQVIMRMAGHQSRIVHIGGTRNHHPCGNPSSRDTASGRGTRRPENLAERRQGLDKCLESGLEDSFPASDAINIVQPPP
jgi:hypothetical protein